ncbi:cell envelope integrity protein CreD [Azonexus caeni]|jgi:inner membrane protein|uniref:cell envelope integrity protein CreD n=1 Tax=Azonexus caeni TaxID=266126 RepID=UPI003A88A56C
MDRKLFYKIAAIVGMSILLLVPLSLIEGQIRERSQRQQEVQRNIANSAAGEQTLVGPVILLEFRERVQEPVRDPDSGKITGTVSRIETQRQLISAESLNIDGTARVENRHRGIYQARLFHLDLSNQAKLVIEPFTASAPERTLLDAEATLVLGVADPRGVDVDPEVTINGQPFRFITPGNRLETGEALKMPQLIVPLGRIDPSKTSAFDVSFPLQLTGTSRLAIAPSADSNRIHLKSDWPHPNFGGRFLPRERSVGADGFDAQWAISHLARDFDRALDPNSGEALSIDFVDPVNVYLQSERAVKYGILFIVLTFAGFFLIEILRRAPIHPMQYLLVGLALAIFFLLLIALSEHLSFALAYGLSSLACIALIGFYLAGALGGVRRGLAFAGGLTGLYGVLFGVLRSEDNALLMGAMLLFAALGTTMLATRHVNWHRLSSNPDEA